ncbi:MAG TPA: hypothetical protein VK731_09530 [Candidatus Cybelea sp.]|jgi:hypothetical protein|nr:hypothetical protein [Candidatus Cybelea sp.]
MKPVKQWLYSLGSAVIGGAATSGSAWLGMAGAKAAGVDVPNLNFKALGIILISGGLSSLFFYLKQSPLPKEGEDQTNQTKP